MLPDNATGAATAAGDGRTTAEGVAWLRLHGYVSVAQAERCIEEGGASLFGAELAYIDLGGAVQFDIAGLMRLLAVVARRRDAGQQTRFRLPNDALARHILRLWKFPRAVSVITMTPFRLLVDVDDWVYFGERWPQPHIKADLRSPRGSVLAYLVDRQYFGLSSYSAEGGRRLDRLVESETAHWGSYALSKLLAKVLPGPAADIARVVMQEILTNVLEHSVPRVAIVGSQLDLVQHSETGAPAGLTISVWDDGQSIVAALRHSLPAAGTVRAGPPGTVSDVVIEPVDWIPHHLEYHSGWTPDTTSTDSEVLLASILPGISRTASSTTAPEPAMPGAKVRDRARGGLSALYRSAVDTFSGSVEIRTERSMLSVDRPDPAGPYRLRVAADEALSLLTGDIVTIRLPVSDG
jgi:ABC-type transporter Mla MlaB component